jgi:hypothetical protein
MSLQSSVSLMSLLQWKSRTISNFVGFEVITAVTMKNVVFWDIKTEFVLYRRHITFLLLSPTS